MLLNIVVVSYEIDGYKEIVLYLVSSSLLFISLDLWINTKEKSKMFHKQWFDTSAIVKKNMVKFLAEKNVKELCQDVIRFNKEIYDKNLHIDFL